MCQILYVHAHLPAILLLGNCHRERPAQIQHSEKQGRGFSMHSYHHNKKKKKTCNSLNASDIK